MDTGTLVLARNNTKTTINRVETIGQNLSLNSVEEVVSFKLFQQQGPLFPKHPFSGPVQLQRQDIAYLGSDMQGCNLKHTTHKSRFKKPLLFQVRQKFHLLTLWAPSVLLADTTFSRTLQLSLYILPVCRSSSPISFLNFQFMQCFRTSSRTKTVGSPRVYFYKDNFSKAIALSLEHTLAAGFFCLLKKKKRTQKKRQVKYCNWSDWCCTSHWKSVLSEPAF